MWRLLCAAAVGLPLLSRAELADHCTAIAVGPKATADGASLVGQSADAEGGPGYSVVYVPAQDHAAGSRRPVLDQVIGVKIGSIPQVPHTYAYSYTRYGVMNEHKVAFGESTCSARIAASSLAHNGTALFSNAELTKITLERCTTARCAVKLMGDMAVNDGGFYGEDSGVETGGEALVVADTIEAWVFHILADPTGRSAIWAAQRVPDDHVAFVPNTFVIREMDLHSAEDFMLSPNAQSVALTHGWWDQQAPFNFAQAFSLGEYSSPHYSARRLWRAYDLLAPSLHLDPTKEITEMDGAYPFSVKPDRLLSVDDIFRVYRDYYEGTPFSLVADTLAAGPFNSPLRVAAAAEEGKVPTGAWERPISIYRTDYAVLSACHPKGHGIVWFAPHTPHASIFTPVWTSAAPEVARPYVVDAKLSVDRESLYWAANAVSNWAFGSMFSHAILDIRAAQAAWEPQAEALAEKLRLASPSEHTKLLADFAAKVHAGWWDLFWSLMGKYNDGYVVTHAKDGSVTSTAVGYPSWWLKAVDFEHALDAPSASFANQRSRMAAAAKTMAEIDARRTKPQAARAVSQIVV